MKTFKNDFLKFVLFMTIWNLGFFGIYNLVYGASIDRTEIVGSFVVNVLQDGNPVKELDGVVVVPFNSEYELLLKNDNDRRAVAKVTIDGANISSHGDIVIPANSEIKLERFITDSLDEGKRFQFVPLDNPEVDDPTRDENGIIRVVFQLEKKREFIMWEDLDHYITIPTIDTQAYGSLDCTVNSTYVSNNAQPGATIGGSKSDQKFHKVEVELEDTEWVIRLEMKGI